MNYVSVFSGIEAASTAWRPLGWHPLAFSEIEPRPSEVLAVHYPETPNHGDITQYNWKQYRGSADLVVGGSPCQSFSIAGLRMGLADPRGNLTLAYFAAVDAIRPQWMVWENVPGVLSHDKGRTFGTILGALGALGYGFAYRVLDAQYVRTCRFRGAVPQRRRRVFVVGYLGDWRPPVSVLFERESLCGYPPPRREQGQNAPGTPAASPGDDSGKDGASAPITARFAKHHGMAGGKDSMAHNLISFGGNNQSGPIDVATAVNAHGGAHGRQDFESETFVAHTLPGEGFDASDDGQVAVASIAENQRSEIRISDVIPNITSGGGKPGQGYPAVAISFRERAAVRRLTPLECERLQGFPDHYTAVEGKRRRIKGDEADYLQHHGFEVQTVSGKLYTHILADGPRYRMIGNSMAVNCMEWIGTRIAGFEKDLSFLV